MSPGLAFLAAGATLVALLLPVAAAPEAPVFASGADDFVDSGAGNDLVWAYAGTDTCLATERDRSCEVREAPGPVQTAASSCHGRRATVTGTPHSDRLVGTSGDDVIVGLGGTDRIEGGPGADIICAGSDGLQRGESPGGVVYYDAIGDAVSGGAGDDLIDLGYDERQVSQYGFAPDRLLLDGAAGTTLRLAASGARGTADGAGHDRIVGQRLLVVRGSPGPDRIWGSPYDDWIDGRGGDDDIHGLGGRDVLYDGGPEEGRDRLVGGPGRDALNSGSDSDQLEGGPGDDNLVAIGAGAALSGGDGNDQVTLGGVGTVCVDVDGDAGRDNLSLRPSYDARHDDIRVDLDGGAIGPCGSVTDMESLLLDYGFSDEIGPHWIVRGTPRAERVSLYNSGRLTAHLRGGDDTLVGANFDDVLDGGPGDDTADGGGGNDACPAVEHATGCEKDRGPTAPT